MKTFTLRLDEDIMKAVGEAAKQQRLSKQQWVENVIRESLERPMNLKKTDLRRIGAEALLDPKKKAIDRRVARPLPKSVQASKKPKDRTKPGWGIKDTEA